MPQGLESPSNGRNVTTTTLSAPIRNTNEYLATSATTSAAGPKTVSITRRDAMPCVSPDAACKNPAVNCASNILLILHLYSVHIENQDRCTRVVSFTVSSGRRKALRLYMK